MKNEWVVNEWGIWVLKVGLLRIVVGKDYTRPIAKWEASIDQRYFFEPLWDDAETAKKESVELFKKMFTEALKDLS